MNKLEKLSSKTGVLKGGFNTLTISQMSKLKGGVSGSGSNIVCYGCSVNILLCR